MGRLLQAAVLVASMAGVTHAKPATRKVKIETTPPGATVYIDDVESGAACEATPCTINAPIGSVTLIIRLDGHDPELMPLDVAKGKKAIPISVKLKRAIGVIRVDAPRGATVKVNDEDRGKVGKVPLEIEVPAEPASVVITYDGKTQTELIDISPGEQVDVAYKGGGSPSDDGDDVAVGDDDTFDDDDDGVTDGGRVDASAPAAARGTYIEAGAAFDVGFRQFSYEGGIMPFNNSGEVVIGPAIEVWPGRMLGIHPLRGFSLFGRVQFSVSHQNVTRANMGTVTNVGASTFWGALEVSMRNKWTFGSIGVEASAGFVRDQVEFSATNMAALEMVPSADYKSLRLGARVSYLAMLEPYAGVESRIVFDGGQLATRADSSEVSGYRGVAGVRTRLGPLGVRGEFSYAKYNWTFTGASRPAPSASDTIMWLSFLVAYDY